MPFDSIIYSIPELMGIGQINISIPFNQPDWYISSLLISSLLLCYIYLRNHDFYVNVFAPLTALTLFSILFSCCSDMQYEINTEIYQPFFTGVIRAVCGMSFGAIAWLICEALCKVPDNRHYRLIITLFEIVINILFFYTCFVRYSSQDVLFCAMLLVPPIVAIAISGKSYISELFKGRFCKSCSSLSLTIFLNHWIPTMVASVIVRNNLLLGFVAALALTAVFALINALTVRILRAIGKKITSAT